MLNGYTLQYPYMPKGNYIKRGIDKDRVLLSFRIGRHISKSEITSDFLGCPFTDETRQEMQQYVSYRLNRLLKNA